MCQSNGPWSYHPICQAVLLQQIINSIWITAIWFVCCVLHKKVRFCFPSVLYILQHRDCTYKQQKPVLSVSVEESNKDIPHLLWFDALTTNSVIRCFHLVDRIQTAKKDSRSFCERASFISYSFDLQLNAFERQKRGLHSLSQHVVIK